LLNKGRYIFVITREKALAIASKDAGGAYRDLSVYEVTAEIRDDRWYVDYEFRDKNVNGGGPHYVISAQTGEIVARRYEQ
jgi:uncharacterized membrane protein YkoI